MAEYSSGSIRVTGLGSDTDFDSMIDKLYEVESLQAQKLLKWKKEWQARQDAFKELRTEMVTLQTALKKMNTVDKFLKKTFTTTDSAICSATLSEATEARDYSIDIHKLARNSSVNYQTSFAKAETAMGCTGGGLMLKSGTNVFGINITPQTSLQGVVNMINNHVDNKTIKASVVQTTDGMMLQIRSKDSGDNTAISIESVIPGGGDLQGFPPNGQWADNGSTLRIEQGNDAEFSLDGSSSILKSASNDVKKAIPGITFNLRKVGQANISVKMDNDKIKENITTFVESVNKLRAKFKELTSVNPNKNTTKIDYADSQFDAQKGALLTGNYGVQLINSKLKSILASTGVGFINPTGSTPGDFFSALSQIGILSNPNEGNENYGLLEINDKESSKHAFGTLSLEEALKKDPEAIARLFAADMDPSVFGTSAFSFSGHIATITKPGSYDVKYTVAGDGSVTGTIGGHPATFNKESGQFTCSSGPSQGLVIMINDFTPGAYTGTVNMRQGKVNELLTALQGDGSRNGSGMLDKTHGSLSILEDNYTQIMKNIDKKVIQEDERLGIWERRMRLKFARLEKTLATYNGQLESLKSQISTLPSGGGKK